MTVPFLDLRAPYLELREEIDDAVRRVLESGWYLLGPEVEAFEAEFAAYCGAAHCVAVGSGGDALSLILRGLGIGAGDEVIVPSHTFIATWLAVSDAGATPVPVEPDPATFTMDPARIETAITTRTRAILPVHLYGHPAELDAVRVIADRHGLAVVEDAAQSPGAVHKGQRIGASPSTVAFSFYPGKNLGALGDSGAVVTSDRQLADKVRLLRNYGSRVKYRHEVLGTNSRTDEIQAAVLRVKLPKLDEWNARRTRVAERYLAGLKGLDLGLPSVAPWAEHAWHLFVVRVGDRPAVAARLEEAGVGTLVHYPVAVHRSPAYTPRALGPFPLAETLADDVLSLPIGPHLTEAQVDVVVEGLVSVA